MTTLGSHSTSHRARRAAIAVVLLSGGMVGIGLARAAPVRAATSIIDLGTLGGPSSEGTAIDGTIVVGSAQLPDGATHAFAYDLADTSPALRDLGTLGAGFSAATDVDGTVVIGGSVRANGTFHGFAYDLASASPTMIDLGTLGGDSSSALAVSGRIVVGASRIANATSQHAFVYDLGAGSPAMRDLGTLGGSSSYATDVDGSIVVGYSQLAGDAVYHPFAYDLAAPTPTMIDLGDLGAGGTFDPVHVSGQIVAGFSNGGQNAHPFAYDLAAPSPTMIDLGSLGGTRGGATAIDGSVVVGSSYLPNAGVHAFAYDLAATSPSMIDLGGTFSYATGVDGHLVVGYAGFPNAGAEHAFLYDLAASSPSMIDLGSFAASSYAWDVSGQFVVGTTYLTADQQFSPTHATVWNLAPDTAAATTTTLVSSANPTLVNGVVTYTATITPAPDGGTVAFHDGADPIAGCEAQPVASSGEASCEVTYDEVGSHTVTARYSGNTGFAASMSVPLTEQVSYGVRILTRSAHSIRLELIDANGRNLSSSDIAVTVAGIAPDPAPGTVPSGTFRFVARRHHRSYYVLDVDTSHFPRGTYVVSFTASGDPVTHTASLVLRRAHHHHFWGVGSR